jgi:lipopolysaccharide/colanic/teichoic acid biosynthesis glycosyltransferase
VLKRCVDIALAIFLLLLAVPLLAVAAIAIKLDSEGPVLFWQTRMGWRHQRFWLVKLRTVEFSVAYQKLLEVRPGLTDPASLKYRREERVLAAADDPLAYFKTVVTPDKLRISEAYLNRANVWSDFLVMLRTAWGLFPVHGGR